MSYFFKDKIINSFYLYKFFILVNYAWHKIYHFNRFCVQFRGNKYIHSVV